MAFTRKFLTDLGLTADVAETILAERSRSLEDYILKADAKTAEATAITDALSKVKPPEVNVKEHEDYKALDTEYQTYKKKTDAKTSDDFKAVKGKFFDTVYEKLDHSKPYADQIKALQKDYEEYFNPEDKTQKQDPPPANKQNPPPQFSQTNTSAGTQLTAEQKAAAEFRSAFGLPATKQ